MLGKSYQRKRENVCACVCACAAVINSPGGQRFRSLDGTYGAKLNNSRVFAVEKLNKHVLFCGTTLPQITTEILCINLHHVSPFHSIILDISDCRVRQTKLTAQHTCSYFSAF